MDINLPGQFDGIEVAAKISEHRVPVVFLTAFSDSSTIARASETNPYGFLVKPFKTETIHSTIEIALAKNRIDKKIASSLEWFQLAFRNIDRGIVVIDKEGKIVLVNACAEKSLGPFSALFRTEFCNEIIFHDDIFHEQYILPLYSVLSKGLALIIPSDISITSGWGAMHRIEEAAISPVTDVHGSIHGAIFVYSLEGTNPSHQMDSPDPGQPKIQKNNTSKNGSSNLLNVSEVKEHISENLQLERAHLCLLLGKYDEAESILDNVLAQNPQNIQLLYTKGIIQKKLGRHSEALRTLEKAIKINPSFEEAQARMSEIYTILSMKKTRD